MSGRAGTDVDRDSIQAAYEDVRDDTSDTTWAMFTYEDSTIKHTQSGASYDDFQTKLTGDDRLFAFVRMTTGDELSKRAKFALITWIGENVGPLQKARMSMDKMMVKDIVQNIAIEIQTGEMEDVGEEAVKSALIKASGANYGTGVRD